MDKRLLFEIAARHCFRSRHVVIPEPYVPHFPADPETWNGILVVAEAQNLSDKVAHYRSKLLDLSRNGRSEELCDRLNLPLFKDGEEIGIGPWDDGTIKLSLACIRGLEAVDRVAVSNAVVWSSSEGGSSEHLRREMVDASVRFWRGMLGVLRPKEILAFGATARNVMSRAGYPKDQLLSLPGPFGRALQIGFKMDVSRLLQGFPEVTEVLDSALGAFRIKNEQLAIHCACASVSRMLDRNGETSGFEHITSPICLDADSMNADWTKQTWDLPATSRAELLEMLEKQNTSVQEFKKLPVFLMNVDKIEWLKEL